MYCTADELLAERLSGESYDYPSVERAIMDASDAIDMRLSGQYITPFSPVPAIVRRLCLDMACCFLMKSTKAMIAQDEQELASSKFICDKAEKELDRLATGKLNLPRGRRSDARVQTYSGNTSYLYVEE